MSTAEGPYFDELTVGDVFDTAPSVTLTTGRAATHHAICGGRLPLSLDAHLSEQIAGRELADPALVWDIAIGQSTLVTRRVVANLFYRGLAFHRLPSIGDSLHTRTEVVGLKQNSSRPSGLATLRMTTRDQQGRLVLDFWRCAMLPLSSADVSTGHNDNLSDIGSESEFDAATSLVKGWQLQDFPSAGELTEGDTWQVRAGDVVTSAPELARLSLNLAHVHHDRFAQPSGRLVYGGHTIALALSQVTRTLPNLITVVGWHGCDHTGPVRENDTLTSEIHVEGVEHLDGNLRAVTLNSKVYTTDDSGRSDQVLDWRFVALSR